MSNIAHLLPYSAHYPLKTHNGRYAWALQLARMQAQEGHTVMMYCAPDSNLGGTAIKWQRHIYESTDKLVNNTALIKQAFSDQSHDIFHSHFDSLHYDLADMTSKPVVATQHWFPTRAIAEASQKNTTHNVLAVPVTDFMASTDDALKIRRSNRIYHGIDTTLFHPVEHSKAERLIFVGRIAKHKGVHLAVDAAIASDQPLDIVGKINPVDEPYWQQILPKIDGTKIRYLGAKAPSEVAILLANAKALIFPSQIIEAFGQTTIEAQACDTPVIITDNGASRELVKDGVTGYVVMDQAGFIEAIANIDRIDRTACRSFAKNFDISQMYNGYNELYQQLLD